MFKYNNTHIFTGYLKQLLSSSNLPACRIYTREFARYLEQHGKEDPKVLESFDLTDKLVRINYLKNDEVYNYYSAKPTLERKSLRWQKTSDMYFNKDRYTPNVTRSLNSRGITYDYATHEYLGDYLRFLRDYYDINLMSMYNCFNDKIYNNIHTAFIIKPNETDESKKIHVTFNAQDQNYRIYAIPVKLFEEYTIAIDCSQGIELFCGLYSKSLAQGTKETDFAARTYVKLNNLSFKQPVLYDKLCLENWKDDFVPENGEQVINTKKLTRWEAANREKDLKLIIKVPASCRSSIAILEGDYRSFNDFRYAPVLTGEKPVWKYSQNHTILNFNINKQGSCTQLRNGEIKVGDGIDLNNYKFKPISKLQLLAFNTGESYPFADRLVEYLSGSAITPLEEIPDNIKRAQQVMSENNNYFQIEGLWEDKMQKLIYDYVINSGPMKVINIIDDKTHADYGKELTKEHKNYTGPVKQVVKDLRQGIQPTLGHNSKSTLYDVLGYVDKDAEKLYASWKKADNKAVVKNNIQNVDIYNGLYDI